MITSSLQKKKVLYYAVLNLYDEYGLENSVDFSKKEIVNSMFEAVTPIEVRLVNGKAKEKGTSAFYMPFNRQQLADYLGVERSAMSAEISRLASLGLLETRRSYFKLLKP